MADNRASFDDSTADSELPQWVIKRTELGTGEALPPSFPYIIDNVSGDICQVALLFMADEYLTDRLTFVANTVEAYTSDLRDWTDFGTKFGIPWDKATYADLGRYVDSQNLVSPHTGKASKQATVDRRLVAIEKMYEWAATNLPQFCDEAPEGSLLRPRNVAHFIDDRRKELRNRADVGGESTEDVALPNVMQPTQLAAVLKAIGPAPVPASPDGQYNEDAQTSIGHLGMYVGCQAGLRVGEVVDLKVKLLSKYIDKPIVANRLYDIGPIRRKGGKSKLVKFHGILLQKVIDYIKGERECAMRGCNSDHGVLLVHRNGRYRGKRITKCTLQRRFAKACVAAGLVQAVSKFKSLDPDKTKLTAVIDQRAAFVFHDLRHTFAVWMYYARKADGDSEPWKFIQEQLGHEDVTTTIKTYLKVTQDFEADVSDKFISSLNFVAGLVEPDVDVDEGKHEMETS